MPYGISVHIGLNTVDPEYYEPIHDLVACHNDARSMMKIAQQNGFDESYIYLDEEGTSYNLIKHLKAAAARLKKGDTFLLTYSGHGGSVEDKSRDEDDGYDETWCLYNRLFFDDEFGKYWSKFKTGVRIIMASDSCHSGSVSRRFNHKDKQGVRTRFNRKTNLVYQRHKKEYEQIPEIISNIRHTDKIKATVLLLSGCQDGQESEDGKRNGQFTRALLRAYNKGSFRGGYEGLMASMVRMMPDYQTPNLSVIGRKNPEFVSSRPFKK